MGQAEVKVRSARNKLTSLCFKTDLSSGYLKTSFVKIG